METIVADFGDNLSPARVAENGDYSLQCGQGFTQSSVAPVTFLGHAHLGSK